MKAVVEINGERLVLSGALAEMIAVCATRGQQWGLDHDGVVTVHFRRGDGWVKVRVEREDPPIRDKKPS